MHDDLFDVFENKETLPIPPQHDVIPSNIVVSDAFTLNATSHCTLHRNDTSVRPLEILPEYSKKAYNFELDTFQKLSLSAIERNEHLLISAHTSAGKTVIAEYAIAHCVTNNQRCIYTSPIKALSNQKYRELQALCDSDKMFNKDFLASAAAKENVSEDTALSNQINNRETFSEDVSSNSFETAQCSSANTLTGVDKSLLYSKHDFPTTSNNGSNSIVAPSVGLLTGDVTINPNASILVMTTEILRNMLYKGSTILKEVGYIVFDEIHYLKDIERGVVWEEAIILAPNHFRFVFLSATIPNAVEFGSWVVSITGQPCHLVSTDRRPTPLEHYIWSRNRPYRILYDKKGDLKDEKKVFMRDPNAQNQKSGPKNANDKHPQTSRKVSSQETSEKLLNSNRHNIPNTLDQTLKSGEFVSELSNANRKNTSDRTFESRKSNTESENSSRHNSTRRLSETRETDNESKNSRRYQPQKPTDPIPQSGSLVEPISDLSNAHQRVPINENDQINEYSASQEVFESNSGLITYKDGLESPISQVNQNTSVNNKLTPFNIESNAIPFDTANLQELLPKSESATQFDKREFVEACKNVLIKKRLDESDIQAMVAHISKENLLPCIIFAFSRKECEAFALALKNDFLKKPEKQKIQEIFDAAISGLREEERNLDLIQKFLPLLQLGIGIHHAGLLPIIKEIVEILFQENLLRVLFATETFSIGLNMPAKCVVFTSLKKFDGEERRFLKSGEYIQMSGRAGRRNLDKKGIVFSMLNEHLTYKQGRSLFSGAADRLDSAFRLGYNMILNLMRIVDVDPIFLIKRSFFYFQSQNRLRDVVLKIQHMKSFVEQLCVKDNSLNSMIDVQIKLFEKDHSEIIPGFNDAEISGITSGGSLSFEKNTSGSAAGFNPAEIPSITSGESFSLEKNHSEIAPEMNTVEISSLTHGGCLSSIGPSEYPSDVTSKTIKNPSKTDLLAGTTQVTNGTMGLDTPNLTGTVNIERSEFNDLGHEHDQTFLSETREKKPPSIGSMSIKTSGFDRTPTNHPVDLNDTIFPEYFFNATLETNLSLLDPEILQKIQKKYKPSNSHLFNIHQGYAKLKLKKNLIASSYFLKNNYLQKGRLIRVFIPNNGNNFIIDNCKIRSYSDNGIFVEFMHNKILQVLKIRKENIETVYDVMAMNLKALREAIKSGLNKVHVESLIQNYNENFLNQESCKAAIENDDRKQTRGAMKDSRGPSKTHNDKRGLSSKKQKIHEGSIRKSKNVSEHQKMPVDPPHIQKTPEIDSLTASAIKNNDSSSEKIVAATSASPDTNHQKSGAPTHSASKNDTEVDPKVEELFYINKVLFEIESRYQKILFLNECPICKRLTFEMDCLYNKCLEVKEIESIIEQSNESTLIKKQKEFLSRSRQLEINGQQRTENFRNSRCSEPDRVRHHNHNRDNRSHIVNSREIDDSVFLQYGNYLVKRRYLENFNNLNKDYTTLKNIYHLNECKKMIQVLRRLSYYDKQITIKGRVACEISTADELILTELIFNNAFLNMPIDQIVALCSCLIFHETDNSSSINASNKKNYEMLKKLMKNLTGVMNNCGLDVRYEDWVKRYSWEMMDIAQAWVNGKSFVEICGMSNIFEGSIIRAFRRLEELLKQLCAAAREIGNSELENLFASGIVKIKRDIVFSSSLYL